MLSCCRGSLNYRVEALGRGTLAVEVRIAGGFACVSIVFRDAALELARGIFEPWFFGTDAAFGFFLDTTGFADDATTLFDIAGNGLP
jgi:hypothetical protein